MAEENRLVVGRKVDVKGLGTLLHHNASNGTVSFIGRAGDGIQEYSSPREHVTQTSSGYEFVEPPKAKFHALGSGVRYNQLDRQLRSAKL